MPLDTAFSVCPHDCPSACALDVERIDQQTIGVVHGAKENKYTAGVVCAKVARYAERVHHPDRLTKPLRRTGPKGGGQFAEISWDDALDEIAEGFVRATQAHGSETVWPYHYAGTMGLIQQQGLNRFRRALNYSDQVRTICSALTNAGWGAGIGDKMGPDTVEIADSDLIVIWGSNPVHTQVNLMHHIARARKEHGATLVVIDPYRTPTAATADTYIAVRPGTDGALACAVMHVLFRDGYADRDYMAKYALGADRLEQHLSAKTPEWASAITGVPAAEIEAFARLYGQTKKAMIRAGYGFSRSRNGAVNFHAVTCLPTVTGAWAHRGGGAIYSNTGVYKLDMTMIEGLDVLDRDIRWLDMCRLGPVLEGNADDLKGGPPVTAMLIQNTNPMAVAPDSGSVRRGFAREDLFVCVHEQFMTETAAIADIVIPATTFLEHNDLYISLGHSHLQIGPQAIAPVGESRSNHDVLNDLAARLGAEHASFGMSEWELIDWTLTHSGYPGADSFRDLRWIDCQPDFETSHFLNGFPNSDGKFRFAAKWSDVGSDYADLPALPDHHEIIDEADDDHPYRLVTAPSRHYLNTSFTETPGSQRREVRPSAMIHPDDCEALGLGEGDRVRIGNRQGDLVVHVEPFDGLQRGVVIVEGVWPNAAFEEGVGINLLVSADPGPPAGGGVFHDTAVWLRPA